MYPPSTRRPAALILPAVLLSALLLAGCAAPRPSLDDPQVRSKLDGRLRMALSGQGPGEPLGEYIRVSVRLDHDGTDEDRERLSRWAVVGSMIGPVATLTLRPERVVDVAVLPDVVHVELEHRDAPTPSEPPPVR
ncbi:MAG: hypothetical protein R6W82_00045 [bacterium]